MTFPSLLNMLTSSMAWIGWTFSFFNDVCSFLSSVPALLCTFLTFRRGVPLPLQSRCPVSLTVHNKPYFHMLPSMVSLYNSNLLGKVFPGVGGAENARNRGIAYPVHRDPVSSLSLVIALFKGRKETQWNEISIAELTNAHRCLHPRQLRLIHIAVWRER